ncbi:MAG: M24 family metallopeptidase [Lachnospiraceae bacterium]|nr:M24 family metallopeptidase [Lachnospiraceae bacterium]
MIPEKLDIPILITDSVNTRWLHRLPMAQGAIFLSENKRIFFSWGRFTPENLPNGLEARAIQRDELGAAVAAELDALNEPEITVENTAPYDLVRQIEKAGISDIRVKAGTVQKWREIKDEWEIEQLKKASEITDHAFSKILGFLRPGLTELEVAAELERYMRLEDSEEFNKTIVASGPNSSKPHHWPTGRKLEPGDFLTMDYGCTYNGYHSDLTRTVVIGHASDKQRRIYETVYEAQKAARERLTAGLISKEVDAIARNIIDRTEFKGAFLHNLGHGIGLDIHEGAGLVEGSDAVLESGMVVSIEPGIYVKDFGGVRIEDIAVVRRDGCMVLENSDRALIEI